MAETTIAFRRLDHAEGLNLPAPASAAAAGLDLPAAVDTDVTLMPGTRRLVPTGFSVILPEGYEAQVRPRSGLALRHGVTVLNAPGTIDADYRGEIGVILINLGEEPFVVTRGMRIAQFVVAPVALARIVEAARRDDSPPAASTARGVGGFGSTGTD